MIRISIPFTDEIVLDSALLADYQQDEVVVNSFDEVRETLQLSVKHFRVEDIAIYMIALQCPESVCVNVEISNYAWIMNFIITGVLEANPVDGANKSFILNENTYHSLPLPGNDHLSLIIKGRANLFVVCLAGDTVKKLITVDETLLFKKKAGKWFQRLTTPAMTDVLGRVIHCAENNCLHRIFLAAKMLELLYLDIEQLNNKTIREVIPVRPTDLKKLEHARALIVENLQAPCSLIELAHKVGLNDFKLKKGFKETFGNTVFGYLADLRMDKAREMLLSAKYTVSEVAHEVGYKNAHHFTVAFKKKFGYLPSKIGSRSIL